MAGKTTIYHRLQLTHGHNFTESERRREQEPIIRGLVDVFQKAKKQCPNPLPIEDIEVRFQTIMSITPQSQKRNVY